MLTFQGRNESIRSDKLGWFDCTVTPAGSTCGFNLEGDDVTGGLGQYVI